MWEGKLDLGNNETTDFGDVILWLTGNVAAHELQKLGKRIGFVPEVVTQEKISKTPSTAVLDNRYKPEFLDRIDEIVIARKFDDGDLRRMIDVHAKQSAQSSLRCAAARSSVRAGHRRVGAQVRG